MHDSCSQAVKGGLSCTIHSGSPSRTAQAATQPKAVHHARSNAVLGVLQQGFEPTPHTPKVLVPALSDPRIVQTSSRGSVNQITQSIPSL